MISCKAICQNLFPSVPKKEGEDQSLLTNKKEVYHHGSDSGDEGEFPGFSPTELEMLQFSTPLSETDNREQEQLDGTQEELLPDDAEDLSEHDEDTPVSDDCSPSHSETEEEPSLQQEPAVLRSYPA